MSTPMNNLRQAAALASAGSGLSAPPPDGDVRGRDALERP